MANSKRATVYFDSVNAAARHDPDEDAGDLAAFRARRDEPDLDFEEVAEALRRRGAL